MCTGSAVEQGVGGDLTWLTARGKSCLTWGVEKVHWGLVGTSLMSI